MADCTRHAASQQVAANRLEAHRVLPLHEVQIELEQQERQGEVIRVEHLTKRYGSSIALDDVSFTVEPGCVTGLVGPRGAGKTLIMRLLLGQEHPTRGIASIRGVIYRELDNPFQSVGSIAEAKGSFFHRSGRSHLLRIACRNRVPEWRIDEVLGFVGLLDDADRPIRKCASNTLARLGIATALLANPPVLILDEPLSGLDHAGARWFHHLIREFAAENRTILLSSQTIGAMQEIVDQVVVIDRGHIVARAPIADILNRDGASSVRVVAPDFAAIQPILETAGASCRPDQRGGMLVTGMSASRIGDVFAMHRVPLHQLVSGGGPEYPERLGEGDPHSASDRPWPASTCGVDSMVSD